jgi:DNA-binding CsgD family transcriptional regulator/pimeloyl-ACP methyl ester carboxylesterase
MDPPPVQYVTTSDRMAIAYCVSGEGVPLVLMPFPYNNLHLMWREGQFVKFFRPLAERFRVIQYDSRGLGMSTRGLKAGHTLDDYLIDLEAVVQAAGLERFVLLGGFVFANVAARYALAHPERLLGLILLDQSVGDAWGGRIGMGQYEETARRNWEEYVGFLAGGMMATPEQRDYYNESITQDDFLTMLQATYGSSIDHRLPGLRVPTLVTGTRWAVTEPLILIEQAKQAAALIPDAQLALFEDWPRHLYPVDDRLPPAIPVIEQFVRGLPVAAAPVSAAYESVLSSREAEVLRLLAAGRSNQQIADELVISVNTVRRHVSNIFDKTGAANRTEAAVYARDHGLP